MHSNIDRLMQSLDWLLGFWFSGFDVVRPYLFYTGGVLFIIACAAYYVHAKRLEAESAARGTGDGQ